MDRCLWLWLPAHVAAPAGAVESDHENDRSWVSAGLAVHVWRPTFQALNACYPAGDLPSNVAQRSGVWGKQHTSVSRAKLDGVAVDAWRRSAAAPGQIVF
jgi:hypothetical protein